MDQRDRKLKIVAGLGSIEEYIPYVEAGADELFCGYVPEQWAMKYGMMTPLNRREVLYYNVQIGSFSEMEILRKMVEHYGVPVTITVNALYYRPEQYPFLEEWIRQCRDIGFSAFIIADPALLLYFSKKKLTGCRLHMSGETAEVNHRMVEEMREFGISRVIFHRKVTITDMAACIAGQRKLHPEEPLEYEAFVLNEMCHFTGAFCSSLHCDELTHMCRVPYVLGGCREKREWKGAEECCGPEEDDAEELIGRSGCGLCALWSLRRAGITHLKLVSRGNYAEDTIRDIRQLKKALDILEESESESDYQKKMKAGLFPGDCSHQCYYRSESDG